LKQSKYVIEKRRNEIVELLHREGKQQVKNLSTYFDISPLTIRRDLAALEDQGIIERVHGGACIKKLPVPLTDFTDKQAIHHYEKEQIARYALSYIQDGSTVFMNSGTTILQLLKLLDNRYVNIVTNNVLAYQYCQNLKGDLIYTGGTYKDTTKACYGDFATNVIGQIYGNLCILGVNGISAENGVTTSQLQETIVNGKMIDQCTGKIIIIADSSKIGKTFSFTSAKIENIDILITGSDADAEELQKIKEKGVEIYQVDSHTTE
jgi:DeoR/GlpR family transcriptional regulator of sugar metabolism